MAIEKKTKPGGARGANPSSKPDAKDSSSDLSSHLATEIAIRAKDRSAGKTPFGYSDPTTGGIVFYQWGKDPGHAARLRAAAARKRSKK